MAAYVRAAGLNRGSFRFEPDHAVTFDLPSIRSGLKPLWPGVLGIAALTATACSGKVTRAVDARILHQSGSVSIEGAHTPAKGGRAVIQPGATLQTGPDGTVDLLVLPGMMIHLQEASTLQVDRLALTKNGNATDEAMSREVAVRIIRGSAVVVVQFESDPGNWSLTTPAGVFTTRLPGTFFLRVDQNHTRLTCVRGAIEFATAGQNASTSLSAGYFREWPGQEPESSPVELDPQAQEEVERTLRLERNLLQLARRERFSPFPWRDL